MWLPRVSPSRGSSIPEADVAAWRASGRTIEEPACHIHHWFWSRDHRAYISVAILSPCHQHTQLKVYLAIDLHISHRSIANSAIGIVPFTDHTLSQVRLIDGPGSLLATSDAGDLHAQQTQHAAKRVLGPCCNMSYLFAYS